MSGSKKPGRVASQRRNILLQFDPELDKLPSGKKLSDGISCAAAVGQHLWVAHDETATIERLTIERVGSNSFRFAEHRRFDLGDFITLPSRVKDSPAFEADLEGMAFCDDYLWMVGSHSAHRDGAEGRSTAESIAALAKVRRASNRFVLARIPTRASGAEVELAATATGEDRRTFRAATLSAGRKNDALTTMLENDPHLAPFLAIPSKDNGFDIEGLAAGPSGHLFLGLRAPVLDGWACILELKVDPSLDRRGNLRLRNLQRHPDDVCGARYRKHFLDLSGMGVRDLCRVGKDLLVLTGPPMRGGGRAQLRVWRNAFASKHESLLDDDDLPILLDLPYPEQDDHPEAVALVGTDHRHLWLLVINDSAGKRLRPHAGALRATLHQVAKPSP